MTVYDGSTEHSISGGLRFYPSDLTDRHCVSRPGTRLCLGHLDIAGHLPCLAERANRLVRCALEHTARQHRAHGAGILFAVMAVSLPKLTLGRSPVFTTGGLSPGYPHYLGEKAMMMKTVKRTATAVGLLALSATQSMWAALPTPVAPSTAPAAGDWIALIKGYIKDGGLVLGLAIAVLGFLWIAYLGFAKFNEARQGKAEWAEVGVLGIVGAIVLIFASYLLTEAAGVI